MRDIFNIYHYNVDSKIITLLEKVKVEHGFVSNKYLRSCLAAFAEEYFKDHEEENPENMIYLMNEYGCMLHHFRKNYFSPEADEEPFDLDKEKDVDWNGGMDW